MATLLFFIVPKAEAQNYTCTSSINVASGASINVGANQTVCLTATSGTYNPSSITIATTGTLVIKAGVKLSFTGWPTNLGGKIINLGTLNLGGNLASGRIENYGHTTINQMQQPTSNSNPITLTNNGLLEVSGYWALYNAYINNQSDSVIFHSSSTLYNTTIDNSGYMEFTNGINNTYNSSFNNYGYFKVGSQIQFNDGTYLSNDSTMSFNGGTVNFQGALFTNNGRIMVNGGHDFHLDKATNGIANNGIWVVSGSITFGAAITLTNNCRIVANGDFQMNTLDTLYNNGLLWITGAGQSVNLTTTGSTIINGSNGFVRAEKYKSTGPIISGFGIFYFTGTTTNGGSIIGSSASNPIKFYTPSGNPVGGTKSNVTFLPISSIGTLKDTTNYDCGGNPVTVVGNPPYVKGDTVVLCSAAPVTFHLITDGLITPYDNTYTISWSTLKLFSIGGAENTTTLATVQGTWIADTTNKTIVFTPAAGFTSGTATAQFKVADKKTGNPTTYPSTKALLMVKVTPVWAPTNLNAEGY
ncbi:MAG TPA: hypothetical protein VFL76_04600 [Edaphocola sp.]|nr:hypothetical protein [Edaphocola sp.]